jgi:hypothetical protein
MNAVDSRLAKGKVGEGTVNIDGLDVKFPGLFKVLDSLVSSAAISKQTNFEPKEWNPFSQRVYMQSASDLSDAEKMMDVDQIIDSIGRFLELSHEAMHILLWEPLFVGFAKSPITSKTFSELSLCFEGFCFWYADIIITKNLRERFLDGEFIFNRNAVSQPGFHPYRAFSILGINDPIKILDLYGEIFSGKKDTLFYRKKSDLYIGDLLERFGGFYVYSINSIRLLYKEYEAMNFFSEYKVRFCDKDGLPSLLNDDLLLIDWQKNPQEYCKKIFKIALPSINAITKRQLTRVQQRRSIQTRAYHAYGIISALNRGLVFSAKRQEYKRNLFKRNLEIYLVKLESALMLLAKNGSIVKVQHMMNQADIFYSKYIRVYSEKNSLWLNSRFLLFPNLTGTFNRFGRLGESEELKWNEMNALTRHALRISYDYLNQLLNKKSELKNQTRIRSKIGKLILAVPKSRNHASSSEIKKWKSAFNSLVLDKEILKIWSVELCKCDPQKNKFREVNFVYT